MRRGAWLAASLWAALALALPAQAHQRSLSYSTWQMDEHGARVHVRVSQLDLSRLGLAYLDLHGAADPVARYLGEGVVLRAGEALCEPAEPPQPREAPDGWAIYSWRVDCPDGGDRTLESSLFLDVAPSHLHFTRVTDLEGRTRERVLSEAEPRWTLHGPGAAAAPQGSSLFAYVALGVEHILTGWDHMAFVLALLLLAGTLAEVATLVTAFTVAHSVTLALATLGWVRPEAAGVEALIGFSIALVAAENSWILSGRDRWVPLGVAGGLALLALGPPGAVSRVALLGLALFSLCHFGLLGISERPARLRAAVAFVFGLVHGFGFASVLAQLELPTQRLVPALFGFNIGVELGQLTVVLAIWPLLHFLARPRTAHLGRWVTEAGSAAICGLGLYWFLVRSLG